MADGRRRLDDEQRDQHRLRQSAALDGPGGRQRPGRRRRRRPGLVRQHRVDGDGKNKRYQDARPGGFDGTSWTARTPYNTGTPAGCATPP
ncbi:MAG: hypothetical protein U0470_07155 [Anaerolineae bacterium]